MQMYMPISEWIHNEIMDYVCGYTNILLYAYFVKAGKLLENKTQWLCKRLAGPIIPLSWSNMVWKKGFTYGCGRWGAVNSHSPVCWVIFGMVTPEQPNHRKILVQACSWPVRRQSFAKYVGSQPHHAELFTAPDEFLGLCSLFFQATFPLQFGSFWMQCSRRLAQRPW